MEFNKIIKIGNKVINEVSPTFIVAEVGVNHNADIELGKRLIDLAVEAGVDAVKFQSFKADHLLLKSVQKAPYQMKTTDQKETQYQMLKRLEINREQMLELQDYCEKKNTIFMTTPFEEESLKEVRDMNVSAIKVAATDITNIKFLRQIASLGKPIILSAGMCYLEEIRTALNTVLPINPNVILLQCTANYPIQNDEVNLKVIPRLRSEFDVIVGYSDHSVGIGAAPYAVALGAKLVEKHFTLNRSLPGPDQKASIMPNELKQMVQEIRKVELFLGSPIKMPTYSEQYTRKSLQKYLVAKKTILENEIFSEENIEAKRSNGIGIPAIYFDQIIGRRAKRKFEIDEIISD